MKKDENYHKKSHICKTQTRRVN